MGASFVLSSKTEKTAGEGEKFGGAVEFAKFFRQRIAVDSEFFK